MNFGNKNMHSNFLNKNFTKTKLIYSVQSADTLNFDIDGHNQKIVSSVGPPELW